MFLDIRSCESHINWRGDDWILIKINGAVESGKQHKQWVDSICRRNLPAGHDSCVACGEQNVEELSAHFQLPPQRCLLCYHESEELLVRRLTRLNKAVQEYVTPLPGCQPYYNRRPLNVPARFDGYRLIDFLSERHPQVSRENWSEKLSHGEIVFWQSGRSQQRKMAVDQKALIHPERIVRAGERFEHLKPLTVEPDVSADIEIVFEDSQFLVVNKPAPLPLHPSGRFNRNTLQYILDQVCFPERPLIVHRLDANTSGVVVLCRSRFVARVVQPQFEQRAVEKTYLAKVHGVPEQDEFCCDARISRKPATNGVRIVESDGLDATTHFRVLQRFSDSTSLLEVQPLTGRTNQIRVHLWHLGMPIVGDPAYLKNGQTGFGKALATADPGMCLHASRISLHDCIGQHRQFSAPAPEWSQFPAINEKG